MNCELVTLKDIIQTLITFKPGRARVGTGHTKTKDSEQKEKKKKRLICSRETNVLGKEMKTGNREQGRNRPEKGRGEEIFSPDGQKTCLWLGNETAMAQRQNAVH